MMHYVSSSDYLAELPKYFNPDETSYILLKLDESDSFELEINCEYMKSELFYYIYLSQFTEDFEIVIKAGEDVYTTNVVIDTYDYSKLEHWLKLQQLEYLIPVLKKFSWYKVKEAANLASKLSRMQGTEYAVAQMLRLLEVTGDVELQRIWKLVDSKAYDSWHSITLADKGYALTNDVLLQYKTGRIDTNRMQVLNAAKSMQVTIREIADCIQKTLPANITITDAQLIYLSLAFVNIAVTSMITAVISSSVYAANKVTVHSDAHFANEHVTYDIKSKQVLKYSNDYINTFCALLQIDFEQPTTATIYIDDLLFASGQYSGNVNIVIGAYDNILPGKHIVTIQWFNAVGNVQSISQEITLHKCNCTLDIYDFRSYASTDDLTTGEINAIGIYQLYTRHTNAIAKTYCRQVITVPRYYLTVLVPYNAIGQILHIVNIDHSYDVEVTVANMFNLRDFTCQIQTIKDEYIDGDAIKTRTEKYFVLTSKQYASFVDYAFMLNGVHCNVLRTAYAGTVNPLLYAETLQELGIMRNFSIDDSYIANTEYNRLVDTLQFVEDLTLNMAYDDATNNYYLASISKDAQSMHFQCISNDNIISSDYVERQTTVYMHKVTNVNVGQPYVAIAEGVNFKLTYIDYKGEHVLLTSKDCIVFACSKTGKYKLYADSLYYNKQLTFEV